MITRELLDAACGSYFIEEVRVAGGRAHEAARADACRRLDFARRRRLAALDAERLGDLVARARRSSCCSR